MTRTDEICALVEHALRKSERVALRAAVEKLEQENLQHGNVLGRIAIALFGDFNNRTDEECVAAVAELSYEISGVRLRAERAEAELAEARKLLRESAELAEPATGKVSGSPDTTFVMPAPPNYVDTPQPPVELAQAEARKDAERYGAQAMTRTDEIMFTHDSSVIDRLKALSDCCEWANLGWDLPGSATANIKRICDDAISELSKAMTDPMNVGWQHAEAARKDRAAAVSQWRTERKRAERAEAELAEARKDAERYRAYRAYFRDNDADLEIAHALALTDSDAEFDAIWDKEIDAALGFAEPAADVANECAAAIRRMIEELK